ncbi:uncharacterized protein [Halyomorpha halys]|uniref:uncharacterized protein n=1 Tax=Halyomorpha halys TaxID=286706 RepID=UPI0006D50980|nr:uncharacterized protein LOC106686327 [Halyomorpha halys]XP_014285040.1 uncharacterized protein LOC106686327 [Halyomorpha halys]
MKGRGRNLKWTPALPQKKPDSIMSSEYTNSTSGPFIPSYEKEEVNMFQLMAMDYARMWLSERTEEKQIALSSQDNDFLVRRYVIRGLLVRKKEQEQEKQFTMKKFMNVPSKIMIRTKEEIDLLKSKLNDQQMKDLERDAKASVNASMVDTCDEPKNTI